MNKALVVILITVALDSVGIGLIIPIIPDLLRELTGGTNVANRFGVFIAVYALMQFFFSPILGALSDRFGRRPVLLISLAGAAVDYVVMAFAPTLSVLYAGRVVSGITGANMAVATAYVADISAEDERAKRYGYMNACFGIGFVAGPLLGGLIGSLSLRYPFLLAAVLNGLNFLLGCFVLPESHKAGAKRIELKSLNPFASLHLAWGLKSLLPLLTIYVIMNMVGQVPSTLWVIYGEDKFGWDTRTVGLSLAMYGVLHALAQAFLTGPVTARLGERRSLVLGIVTDGLCFVMLALATRSWMVFAIIVPLCAGGIALPALQSLLSKQVGEGQQGELQGTLVSLMSLTSVVGPLAVTSVYSASAATWSGAVWVAGAALYLFCIPVLRHGLQGGGGRPEFSGGVDGLGADL